MMLVFNQQNLQIFGLKLTKLKFTATHNNFKWVNI